MCLLLFAKAQSTWDRIFYMFNDSTTVSYDVYKVNHILNYGYEIK